MLLMSYAHEPQELENHQFYCLDHVLAFPRQQRSIPVNTFDVLVTTQADARLEFAKDYF